MRGDRLRRGLEGEECENFVLFIQDMRGPERNKEAERLCVKVSIFV